MPKVGDMKLCPLCKNLSLKVVTHSEGVPDDRREATIDHIQPQSRNGSNQQKNLQLLCRPCNSSKGARI